MTLSKVGTANQKVFVSTNTALVRHGSCSSTQRRDPRAVVIPTVATVAALDGEVPRGATFGGSEISAFMAAGLAGGFAYFRWNSASSALCDDSTTECCQQDENDPRSGPKIDKVKPTNRQQRHHRVLATSVRYHHLAVADSQVNDETIQTAQAVVESSVDRFQKIKTKGRANRVVDDESGTDSLQMVSEAQSATKQSFKVVAAQLDTKNEREKAQLARFLRALHALVSESSLPPLSTSTALSATGASSDVVPAEVSANKGFRGEFMQLQQDPKHLTPEKAMEYIEAFRNGARFDLKGLSSLFCAVTKTLKHDPSLIDLRGKEMVTIVGDLHGSLLSLTDTLNEIGDIHEDKAVVFNGDVVDRGPNGLEVILTILLLKLAYPNRVFLIRGNHEDCFLATVFGFEDELREKYGDGELDLLWGMLSSIFSALPICCITENAAIMHGGIPSDTFHLDEVRAISADERCRACSVLEPHNNTEQLLQNILWSDPIDEEGITFNDDRGAGNVFGPDVARRFLDRHGLMYLIRSHEPSDEGWTAMDCGDGRFVVTVFSTSDCDDCNNIAVINLHRDGRILPTRVPQLNPPAKLRNDSRVIQRLVCMIASNKYKLAEAFDAITPEAAGGLLTRQQWATVMADVLGLPEVDWMSIQPSLAPTTLESSSQPPHYSGTDQVSSHNETKDIGMIKWRCFLDLHSIALSSSGERSDIDEASSETLYADHAMLLTVFKFLDTDDNGRVDRDDFRAGVELLNKWLQTDQQLQDPDKLFDIVDLADSGEIELDGFLEVFKVLY